MSATLRSLTQFGVTTLQAWSYSTEDDMFRCRSSVVWVLMVYVFMSQLQPSYIQRASCRDYDESASAVTHTRCFSNIKPDVGRSCRTWDQIHLFLSSLYRRPAQVVPTLPSLPKAPLPKAWYRKLQLATRITSGAVDVVQVAMVFRRSGGGLLCSCTHRTGSTCIP